MSKLSEKEIREAVDFAKQITTGGWWPMWVVKTLTEAAEAYLRCANACIEFIRTHHATIRDMAARLEAAERDAKELRRQLDMMTKLAIKLRKDIAAMQEAGR